MCEFRCDLKWNASKASVNLWSTYQLIWCLTHLYLQEDALSWVVEIVSRLESLPQLTIQSPECNHFFLTAMVYASRASNLPLAERLVALYESEKNLVKMPAFTVENQWVILWNRYEQKVSGISILISHRENSHFHFWKKIKKKTISFWVRF